MAVKAASSDKEKIKILLEAGGWFPEAIDQEDVLKVRFGIIAKDRKT